MKNITKTTIKLVIVFLLGLFIGRVTVVPSAETLTKTSTAGDIKDGINKIVSLLDQIEKNTRK